jgi:exoribonuclease-2
VLKATEPFYVHTTKSADAIIPKLTKETVFAIDSSTTTEVDDGISIELVPGDSHPWIHVHIADVSRFIEPNSELDLDARHRGTSIYLPEVKKSMFPHDFSSTVMSLIPDNKINYALTFSARLNDDGSIMESRISPTIIGKVKRFTYEEVEDALLNRSSAAFSPKELEALHQLQHWAVKRKNLRIVNGAQLFSLPQAEFIVTEGGTKVDIKVKKTPISNDLVAEMMILGGQIAAGYADKHQIPIPFRIQQAPSAELAQVHANAPAPPPSLSPDVADLFTQLFKIHGLKRAFSGVEAETHYAIGLSMYTRATSPIRRYTDVLTHYQIRNHVLGKEPPFTEASLGVITPKLDRREAEVKELQKKSERFWMHRYFSGQGVGSTFIGTVVQMLERDNGFGPVPVAHIHFPSIAFLFRIPLLQGQKVELGSDVSVRLLEVSNWHLKFGIE